MACETLARVAEFQDAFSIDMPTEPTLPRLGGAGIDAAAGTLLSLSKILLADALRARDEGDEGAALACIRLHLMTEELGELADAMSKGDMVAVLDALCDLRYVNDGTTLCLGLGDEFMDAFRDVHASNMSKLDADGKPLISDAGRVVKGATYRAPDLIPILMAHAERRRASKGDF